MVTYCLLSQLGLSSGCSVTDIFNAMPIGSIGRFDYNGSTITGLPLATGGVLSIDKCNAYRFDIQFKSSAYNSIADNVLYIGQLQGSDGSGLTWKRVCTTSVADVSITKINIINGIVNPNCNYQVKNGVCYIQLNSGTYSLGENVSGLQLATGLPIPLSGQVANTYVPWASGDASKQVILFVDGVGDLRLHAPVSANGCSVFTSFSYPVSES